MEALSNLLGAMIGLAVVMLILALFMYIVQGIFLTKLNKLMYGKGSALAWIPVVNVYLLGKLTINKIAGWILLIATFCTTTFTSTINGIEKTSSIIPAPLNKTVSNILSIVEFGLLIYAIIKYFNLKKQYSSEVSSNGHSGITGSNNVSQSSENLEASGETLASQMAGGIPISAPVMPEQAENLDVQTSVVVDTNSVSSVEETASVPEVVVTEINASPIQNEGLNVEVQTAPVQEVPVVQEPVVSAFNQQPVQVETPVVEQPVIENVEVVNIEEVPVVPEPVLEQNQPATSNLVSIETVNVDVKNN